MKDIIKHFVIGLVIGLIASGLMVWGYNVGKRHCTNTVDTIIDTIHITDSIAQWKPYDVYHYKYDTAYLPVVDTINDTIIKLDSILVQLPLDIYKFDSIIKDSTHTTHVEATVSGFNVEMQELSIETKITPQEPKKEPWYKNICPAAGIGYGISGVGVFVGVGYKLN